MNLSEHRTARGYTQEDMAKLLGIGVSTYNMYENSQRNIPLKIAEEISKLLGMPIDHLFLPTKFTVSK